MRKNVLNILVFLSLAVGLYFFSQYAGQKWFPQKEKEKQKDPAEELAEALRKRAEEEERQRIEALARNTIVGASRDVVRALNPPRPTDALPDAALAIAAGGRAAATPAAPQMTPPPPAFTTRTPPTLISLGDDTFYNKVLLTTAGGGVQQVVLPRFNQADRLGREVFVTDANGNKVAVPLHLIPGVPQPRGKNLDETYQIPDLRAGKVPVDAVLADPSYALFHYNAANDDNPNPMLGEIEWEVVGGGLQVLDTGEHRVTFETKALAGAPYYLVIRKVYTLGPKDYHVRLRLELEKVGGAKGAKEQQFRYQLAGPRGLPVEGEWYTHTYRVALIGWEDPKGKAGRQYEDAARVGAQRGGDRVQRGDNKLKYMAVATQYFASAACIDDHADDTFENGTRQPWAYVRATTELPFDKKQDPNLPYFDDVTVRAASEPLDLAPGEKRSHCYILYNGPSKVRLLKLMSEDRGAVDPALVDRYQQQLGLKTMVDFRSENWFGRVASFIWWTDLVITFTNLMHWLLAKIHTVVPNWALSIVVLTIMVRLLLFYPSRKQTAMSMKMMEVMKRLQPELAKLQEKYKDDPSTYNREKMRLMMASGVNPFAQLGGCLLLIAQMPIMMGLYFGLQESVFFRLESFLWINNLSAPDMLVWWSEKIPYVSTPEDVGSFLYLGPFFNLLPLLAVSLMLWQQMKMMPPSTDPQAEQQRMVMKVMMVMMAVFFYKVAAGLALYFIVSTLWAILERQLIPKPKIKLDDTAFETAGKQGGGKQGAATAPAEPPKPKGFFGRMRARLQEKLEEMQKRADEMAKRQIRNDPNKPGGQSPQEPPPGQNRRDRDKKNKKRRK